MNNIASDLCSGKFFLAAMCSTERRGLGPRREGKELCHEASGGRVQREDTGSRDEDE